MLAFEVGRDETEKELAALREKVEELLQWKDVASSMINHYASLAFQMSWVNEDDQNDFAEWLQISSDEIQENDTVDNKKEDLSGKHFRG